MRLIKAFLRLNNYQRIGCGLLVIMAAIALADRGIDIAKHQVRQRRNLAKCIASTPLTQWEVFSTHTHGIRPHNNTIIRRLPLETGELPVVIFPKALEEDIWQPLPADNIYAVGAGGENTWKDAISPDNYYLIDVPEGTTGMVFSRLCHRDGDVGVSLNQTLQPKAVWPIIGHLFQRNLIINHNITVKASELPSASASQFSLVVNAGSHGRDAIGQQTQVYYTTEPITIPQEFIDGPEGKYSYF
ncbi:MAG: hypothetical protein AAFS04_05150 [Cyanobacteria bacterium J06631_9]